MFFEFFPRSTRGALLLACLSSGACDSAPSHYETPPPEPGQRQAAFDYALTLGRGINFGNALDAPSEGEWGVTLRAEDFQVVAAAGFDHIRLPVRWSAHADSSAPYSIDPAFLARVDWAIDSASASGLKVVLDVHHYEELYADPGAHEERLIALWSELARHYRDRGSDLGFEVINEPHDALDAARTNQLILRVVSAIREISPERMVIVDPAEFASLGSLGRLALPEGDPNLIATFHYYEPFTFTHQGAEFAGLSDVTDVDWPGPVGDETAIAASFSQAVAWRESANRPLYLGEFGDVPSRSHAGARSLDQGGRRPLRPTPDFVRLLGAPLGFSAHGIRSRRPGARN